MDIMKLSKQFLISAMMAVFVIAGGAGINDAWAAIASGTSGTCSWVIDDAGVLTISPTNGTSGTLASVSSGNGPFYNYRTNVKKVIVEPGVKTGAQARLAGYYQHYRHDVYVQRMPKPDKYYRVGHMEYISGNKHGTYVRKMYGSDIY